jgi:hypothetical protein
MKTIQSVQSEYTPDLRPTRSLCGRLRWCALLLLWIIGGHSTAADRQFRVISGFDYSSGKYQDQTETTMLYIPYFASLTQGRLTWKAGVSWIRIDGPGSVIDGGLVPSGRTTRQESGPGDTWVSLSYQMEAFPAELGFLDITGKLKIPTADEDKGLGTGKFDEVLQIDYMYPCDRLTPMASLSYKHRGDPAAYNLKNTFSLSVGADWRQTGKLHLGASLDYQQASVSGLEDPLELFGYLSYRSSRRWTLMPYLYFGLSEGSPDAGGGMQLIFKP